MVEVNQPQQGVPLCDPSNPYVQPVPTSVTYGVVELADGGQRLAMTFRTPDATFTVFTDKATGQQWHKMMGEHLEQMTSLRIAPADFTLPGIQG